MSIYEFLRRFESWADGYLSCETKADQLYHRYLDQSITEGYEEITPLKEDFSAMKDWLIKQYGSLVPMAHGYIKAIRRLTVPPVSDITATIQYLRNIHRLLVSVFELEISKGVPVPKLQAYLGSNAFLTALVESVPPFIRQKFFKRLVRDGVRNVDTIEGSCHVTSIMREIKTKYWELEMEANACPAATTPAAQQPRLQYNYQQQTANVSTTSQPSSPNSNQPSANFPNKQSQNFNAPNINQHSTNVSNKHQQNSNAPAAPQTSPPVNIQPPFLNGWNSTPLNNWQPVQQKQNNQHQGQMHWNCWLCPIKDHF